MRISIKAARVNAELKQCDTAKALNVSTKTVASWEKGATMPAVDKIEALCALYGVSYDDIRWTN